MAVRRSNSVRTHHNEKINHNENITPEKAAAPSPKSKKCLDLTLAASPTRRRGSPLIEANSLTAGWIKSHHGTPQKENSKSANFEEIPETETSSRSRHSSRAASSPKASPLSLRASLSLPSSPASPLSKPASPAVSTASPLSVAASPLMPDSPDMFAPTPSVPASQWASPCTLSTPRSAYTVTTPRNALSASSVRRRSLLSNILVKSSVSKRSKRELGGISNKSHRSFLPKSIQPKPQEKAKDEELAEAIKNMGKVSFYKSKPSKYVKTEDDDEDKDIEKESVVESILDNNNKDKEKSEPIEIKKKPSLSLKNPTPETQNKPKSEVPPTKSSLEVMKEESSFSSGRSSSTSLLRRSSSVTRSKRASSGRRSVGAMAGRRSTRATRGVKRKSHDGSFNYGVGHAIKKPRYNTKQKVESPSDPPTAKTKDLGYSEDKVEDLEQMLPSSHTTKQSTQYCTNKQTVRQPSKETPQSSPTVGQISMSRHTKVSYEMKGGKMVFRKTPKTPLRRSPRKKMNQSPISKSYFSPKPENLAKHKRTTLFSPERNYLHPESTSSPSKSIPSPVKFNKSSEDEESTDTGSVNHIAGTFNDNQSSPFVQAAAVDCHQLDPSLSAQQIYSPSISDQTNPSSLPDQQVDASSYGLVNLPATDYPLYATEEEVVLNSTPLFYQPPETIEQLLEVMESTGQFGPPQVGSTDHLLNTSVDSSTELGCADMSNNELSSMAAVQDLATITNTVSPDVSCQPAATTAALAVSSILANLSSNSSASSGDSDSPLDADQDQDSKFSNSKLFPIFYKSAAYPGTAKDTTTSTEVSSKRFVLGETDHTQRIIDAGQKVIGATLCLTCGTVYSVGDPQDELQHSSIHSGMMEKLNFGGWKHERVVGEFACGRVVMVKPEDHKHMWNKVEEVLTIVDKDLGFSEVGIRAKKQTKAFMFIADKKVAGLLLAEDVETGYRMIPQVTSKNDSSAKVYCCEEKPNKIICGISRIWVLADYRRKKIGSSLVDCFRSQFVYGHYLREDQFAFSDPTLNGIDFATKYMGNQQFLVYNR